MEQKELIIEALNRAIRVWKSEAHQPTLGDVVVDFNTDSTKGNAEDNNKYTI